MMSATHRIDSPIMDLLGFAAQSYLKDPSESTRSDLNARAAEVAYQHYQELGANERYQWGCVYNPATWLLENATASNFPAETIDALTRVAESHAVYRKRMGVSEPGAVGNPAIRSSAPEPEAQVPTTNDMGDLLNTDLPEGGSVSTRTTARTSAEPDMGDLLNADLPDDSDLGAETRGVMQMKNKSVTQNRDFGDLLNADLSEEEADQ